MITLRLPEEMDKRLSQLAKQTNRSKSYYIKRAIQEFLENQEDYLMAVAAMEQLEKGEEKTRAFKEVLKKYNPKEDGNELHLSTGKPRLWSVD